MTIAVTEPVVFDNIFVEGNPPYREVHICFWAGKFVKVPFPDKFIRSHPYTPYRKIIRFSSGHKVLSSFQGFRNWIHEP